MLSKLLMPLRRWLLHRMRLPRDMVRYGLGRYRSRVALVTPRGALTFSQLGDRAARLVGLWMTRGIRAGEYVFVIVGDGWEQVEIRLAGLEHGVVLTGFNKAHGHDLIVAAARETKPRMMIYDAALVGSLGDRLRAEVPETELVATGEAYEALLRDAPARRSNSRIAPSDIVGLGFTSGTTGEPKALVTTHGALTTSIHMTAEKVGMQGGGAGPFVVGIPLSGAGSGVVLPAILTGSTIVVPRSYTADDVATAIFETKATRVFVTPSTFIDLLDRPDFDREHFGSLRNVVYGTAPMPVPKLREAIEKLGPIFQQGYGMAEVLPPVSLLMPAEHVDEVGRPAPAEVLRSAGRVVQGVRVRIVDDSGRDVPVGTIGRVLVASPTMFSGYWRRPDLTAQVIRDGFMETGDVGSMDPGGWLCILDRRVDVVERDGHFVYPRLVEEQMHGHPAVKEACLVRLRQDGPVVMAVSLRRGRTATVPELQSHLAARLDAREMPDEIRIVPELPRSFLAKVLRREVRAWLEQ